MSFLKQRRLLFLIALPFLIGLLILTLLLVRQQQETRSKAQKSTTLSFSPSALQTVVGDTINLDVMLDPGSNLVSFTKLELVFDSTVLVPAAGAASFVWNQGAFREVLEGPTLIGNKFTISLSTGPDPTKVIAQPVNVGTMTFRASSPAVASMVQFGTTTEVLSIAPSDSASENVIANTVPASVTISSQTSPTPTPISCPLQISPTTGPNIYQVTLSGDQEVPPNASLAQGFGTLTLNPATNQATITISTCGFTSPVTGAHIHGPASVGQSAGIIVPLSPTTQGGVSNVVVSLSSQEVQYLSQGLLYVNFHTEDYQDGEIRGQLLATLQPTQSPTPTLSPTPIQSPTPQPTNTPMPTPTINPTNTTITLNLFLNGIWPSGDNTKAINLSANRNPLFPQRTVIVDVLKSNSPIPGSPFTNLVTYDTVDGKFKGTISIGNTVQSGDYIIKVVTDRYLKNAYPGVVPLIGGTANNLSDLTLVAGDIKKDNSLTILDYNILRDCGYKAVTTLPMTDPASQYNSPACVTHSERANSDLDDNGVIDSFDYNLFVRNLLVQNGVQ